MSVKVHEGGYDFVVVGNYLKELDCSVCLLPFKEAIELPCSHGICKTCLDTLEARKLIKLGMSVTSGLVICRCPICRSMFTRDQVHTSKIVDRIVRTSIRVKCKQHMEGCGWIGTISDYKDHKKKCDHVIIKCDLMGCKEKVKRRDLTEHKRNCPNRIVTCSFCTSHMQFKQVKEHYDVCDSYPVICPHSGCGAKLSRSMMDSHSKFVCQYAHVDCEFRSVGCMLKIQRKEIENHLESSMKHHMKLLLNNSLETKKEFVKTNGELERTKTELAGTKRKLALHEQREGLRELEKKNLQEERKALNQIIRLQLDCKGSNLLKGVVP